MPNKTISLRQDDLALWERAERAAAAARTSVSALVMSALANYLGEQDTITVQLNGSTYARFPGRWLIEPDSEPYRDTNRSLGDPRYGHSGAPEEWRVGIAETARGRIAVYLHHWNHDYDKQPELRDYDTLDAARRDLWDDARVNRNLWGQAAHLLAERRKTYLWRDI